MAEQSLTIGQVADRVGVATSTLRYYDRAGLLPPAERVNGQRRYGPEAVELLLLIRFCQKVGFSLSEVGTLLTSASAKQAKESWRDLVDAKLDQVDRLIAQAVAVRGVLQESRECDCVALDRCSFVTSMAA